MGLFAGKTGIILMTVDEFLLFRVHRFLGCTQFALQEQNLLLELSLILLPLFLRRSAEMLQSLSGMLVLFLQRDTVRFLFRLLPFHVLDVLSPRVPQFAP